MTRVEQGENGWCGASRAAFLEGFWNAAPMNMFAVYPLAGGEFAVEALNPAMEAALGLSSGEVVNRPLAEVVPEEYLETTRERYRQCLAQRVPITYEEEGSMDPSRPRWWETLLVPVLDDAGEVVRIFGVAREITELYESYAEVSRVNAELEKRVAERTRELEAAKDRLEELARVDGLTNVWNRGYLFEIAPALEERCRRQGQPLGGIMLDADHFKSLNDNYGHQAGDEALRYIADTVRANLRAADVVGRFGGEEFLVLLPGAGGATTAQVAERVRQAVADGSVEAAAPGRLPVTVSLGVAAVDPAAEDLTELVRRADSALLRAKQGGRNRCITA